MCAVHVADRSPPTSTVFFFSRCRDHPDLHSFPTRRSSDLRPRRRRTARAVRGGRTGTCRCVPRSEEHTSELQSHVNLVCRLLLEKKKKGCWRSVKGVT